MTKLYMRWKQTGERDQAGAAVKIKDCNPSGTNSPTALMTCSNFPQPKVQRPLMAYNDLITTLQLLLLSITTGIQGSSFLTRNANVLHYIITKTYKCGTLWCLYHIFSHKWNGVTIHNDTPYTLHSTFILKSMNDCLCVMVVFI